MAHIETDFVSRRNRMIGIVVSLLFHSLLFLMFCFMGLTYQYPPPPEIGIEVDMGGGSRGGGSKGGETSVTRTQQPSTTENIPTQNIEPTAPVNTTTKTNPTSTNTPTETPTDPVQVVDAKALFTKKGNSGGSGSGGTGNEGSTGGIGSDSGDGDGGIGKGTGGGIGDFFLKDRPVVSKVFPNAKKNLQGVVKVEFRADRDGNVVYAKAGMKGTTITDLQVWEECERAAKRSKFRAKSDAAIEEMGTITYRFVMQ